MTKLEHSEKEPYIIAETAYIFEGQKEYLLDIISEIYEKKASDAIKYHILLDIDSYMTRDHPGYNIIKNFLLPEKDWLEILTETKNKNFEVIVLADDVKAVEFCKKHSNLVDAIEIHAVAINNIEMLEKLENFNKTILLGIGGAEKNEIEFAINFLKNKKIILMHGFQNYPTRPEYINFNKIKTLRDEFALPVGYADHCSWDFKDNQVITLAGFMAGANIIEKHVTLHPGEKRVDYQSAISISQLKELKKTINLLHLAKGDGTFNLSENEKSCGKIGPMKFTVVAKEDIKKNQIICKESIVFKRTKKENGVNQKDYCSFMGKIALKDIKKDDLLNWENVKK